MNTHLERDSIHSDDSLSPVHQRRKVDGIRGETGVFQQRSGGVRFVWIDGDQFGVQFFQGVEFLAQLRELSMANRSRIAVDEDQHHGLLSSKRAEFYGLTANCFQTEIGSEFANNSRSGIRVFKGQ